MLDITSPTQIGHAAAPARSVAQRLADQLLDLLAAEAPPVGLLEAGPPAARLACSLQCNLV